MGDSMATDSVDTPRPGPPKGNPELLIGGSLGALALGEAAVGLAVCPLCVVGAPVFLAIGAYKKLKADEENGSPKESD